MMNIMIKDFETKFTGWAFIVAALLLWLGWGLSPHHIGEYIVASDFVAIGENVWTWIWMYRIHIFGWVTMGIALFALVSVTAKAISCAHITRCGYVNYWYVYFSHCKRLFL